MRFILSIGLLVSVGVTYQFGGLMESATAGGGLVQYVEGPWPTQDVHTITDDNRDVLASASELADFHKSDFASVYVDASGRVVLVPVSSIGLSLAAARVSERADLSVEPLSDALSISDASELGNELYDVSDHLRRKISAWKGDPRSSRLLVVVWQPLDSSDRSDIEAFATRHSLAIDVYLDPGDPPAQKNESRWEDDIPVAGGFRYTMKNGTTSSATGTSFCSGGFGYHIGSFEYVLTAGHCFEKGTSYRYMWNTYASGTTSKKTYLGSSAGSVWNDGVGSEKAADGQYHGDLALVSVSNAGDQIWWGSDRVNTSSKIPVTVRRVPTVGDPVCINGVTSGSDCGLTVVDTNINHTYSDGDVLRNGDKGSSSSRYDCSQDGDSGGSIIYNHSGAETQATGIGIISGVTDRGSSGCYQWFTGIEEAIQIWGGNINFH